MSAQDSCAKLKTPLCESHYVTGAFERHSGQRMPGDVIKAACLLESLVSREVDRELSFNCPGMLDVLLISMPINAAPSGMPNQCR